MNGAVAGQDGRDGGHAGVGNMVRAAARDILDDARSVLADPALSRADLIHELRKAFKRWRAVLRLLESPLGEPARRMRAEGRELMRALAGARDAQAALDALKDLHKSGAGPCAASVGTIEARLTGLRDEAQTASLDPALRERLSRYLDRASRQVEDWPLGLIGFEIIADQLTDSYRRARRLVPRSWTASDAVALHRLRRRVVEYRHQLELIAPQSPRLAAAWMRQAQRLRDRLGACQDLEVLERFTAPHRLLAPWRSGLLPWIETRRAVHVRAAARIARRLLAPKPKAFRATLPAIWQAQAVPEN